MSAINQIYPKIEPYNKGFLKVSDIHTIYYEECGNKDGIPALFLHGGPGCGCLPEDRRYWDPKAYRIVLFDQRGSGRSTPFCELKDNNTWEIVEDIEKLRKELNVEKFMLLGGSWGSTISLCYTMVYPDSVSAVLIQGIFLCTEEQSNWYHQKGANFLFPDAWAKLVDGVPEDEQKDILGYYYKRIVESKNKDEQLKYARKWSAWEASTLKLEIDHELVKSVETADWALSLGIIEISYLKQNCFLKHPDQLLDAAKVIVDHKIPTTIINGRYDVICPLKSAWELYKRIPHADFSIVDKAGHLMTEEGVSSMVIHHTNKYRDTLFKK